MKSVVKECGLRQQYGILIGYSTAGDTLPPLISMKARRNVAVGKPVFIEITDPYLRAMFVSCDVPPVVCLYNANDKLSKADLTMSFFERCVFSLGLYKTTRQGKSLT